MDFFCNATNVQDKDWEKAFSHEEINEYINNLWSVSKDYVDEDLLAEAKIQLHQRFWEMYLANVFLECSLPLVKREDRRCRSEGPDFQIGNVNVWVEAIAVTPGKGSDAVPKLQPGDCRAVPERQILLRLRSAIEEKLKKYHKYCEKGIIKDGEPYVIAINGKKIKNGNGIDIPWIAKAVFPFGSEFERFDFATLTPVDRGYNYRPRIQKTNNAVVDTDIFLSKKFEGVSAVLYGSYGVFSLPKQLGNDLVVIHNPNAKNPIDDQYFSRGFGYKKNGEFLEQIYGGKL